MRRRLRSGRRRRRRGKGRGRHRRARGRRRRGASRAGKLTHAARCLLGARGLALGGVRGGVSDDPRSARAAGDRQPSRRVDHRRARERSGRGGATRRARPRGGSSSRRRRGEHLSSLRRAWCEGRKRASTVGRVRGGHARTTTAVSTSRKCPSASFKPARDQNRSRGATSAGTPRDATHPPPSRVMADDAPQTVEEMAANLAGYKEQLAQVRPSTTPRPPRILPVLNSATLLTRPPLPVPPAPRSSNSWPPSPTTRSTSTSRPASRR